jgi:hypothetical protein
VIYSRIEVLKNIYNAKNAPKLLPSLSTTKIATPAIINCVYKEIKQHITIFKKKKIKEQTK